MFIVSIWNEIHSVVPWNVESLVFWQLQLGMKYCGQTHRHWLSRDDIENSCKKKPHPLRADPINCRLPLFLAKKSNIVFAATLIKSMSGGKHLKNCASCPPYTSSLPKKDQAVFQIVIIWLPCRIIWIPITGKEVNKRGKKEKSSALVCSGWGRSFQWKDFIVHLKWHIFHCQKFSWQALAKSEMDSGKEFGCISGGADQTNFILGIIHAGLPLLY